MNAKKFCSYPQAHYFVYVSAKHKTVCESRFAKLIDRAGLENKLAPDPAHMGTACRRCAADFRKYGWLHYDRSKFRLNFCKEKMSWFQKQVLCLRQLHVGVMKEVIYTRTAIVRFTTAMVKPCLVPLTSTIGKQLKIFNFQKATITCKIPVKVHLEHQNVIQTQQLVSFLSLITIFFPSFSCKLIKQARYGKHKRLNNTIQDAGQRRIHKKKIDSFKN